MGTPTRALRQHVPHFQNLVFTTFLNVFSRTACHLPHYFPSLKSTVQCFRRVGQFFFLFWEFIQVFARPSMIEWTTNHVCLCPMVYCRCLSRITSPTVQPVCHGYAGGGLANSRLPCAAPARLFGAPRAFIPRSTCLSVCMYVCLSVFLSVCLSESVSAF